MKWLAAVLFSFLSLAGILKDLVVFITFKANQDYIIMTMCTGRDEIVNTCNGSCYLTNQLDMVHDHDQESDSQVPPNLKKTITYYYEEISEESIPDFEPVDLSNNKYIIHKAMRGHPMAIFQPPKYC